MNEERCPECEAILRLKQCQECLMADNAEYQRAFIQLERPVATHCKKGHELIGENLRIRMRKDRDHIQRTCLKCEKARQKGRKRSQAGIPRKPRS